MSIIGANDPLLYNALCIKTNFYPYGGRRKGRDIRYRLPHKKGGRVCRNGTLTRLQTGGHEKGGFGSLSDFGSPLYPVYPHTGKLHVRSRIASALSVEAEAAGGICYIRAMP